MSICLQWQTILKIIFSYFKSANLHKSQGIHHNVIRELTLVFCATQTKGDRRKSKFSSNVSSRLTMQMLLLDLVLLFDREKRGERTVFFTTLHPVVPKNELPAVFIAQDSPVSTSRVHFIVGQADVSPIA